MSSGPPPTSVGNLLAFLDEAVDETRTWRHQWEIHCWMCKDRSKPRENQTDALGLCFQCRDELKEGHTDG